MALSWRHGRAIACHYQKRGGIRMKRTTAVAIGLAPGLVFSAAALALEPEQIFERAAPSIVVVHGFDTRADPMSYGSGVVIGHETVITNCHVLAKTKSIVVRYRNSAHKATLQFPD